MSVSVRYTPWVWTMNMYDVDVLVKRGTVL